MWLVTETIVSEAISLAQRTLEQMVVYFQQQQFGNEWSLPFHVTLISQQMGEVTWACQPISITDGIDDNEEIQGLFHKREVEWSQTKGLLLPEAEYDNR